MQSIDRNLNPDLLKILNNFSNWFFSQDISQIKVKGTPETADQKEYYTSTEYLNSIDKEKHIGYPEITYGIDLMMIESTPASFRDHIMKMDKELNAYFGSKFCAVKMYYPKNGYMGWHNNHNCPGYNILLSYNKSGKGFFRYQDPITREIVTMFDKPGWFAKVGYYGHLKEPDKVYWHCARTYDDRLTLGFVIPDENMWNMMIEDL